MNQPQYYSQQQPRPVPGMTVGNVNRLNVKNVPVHHGERDWSNGVCDCCDAPGTCLLAWFCPCIAYGKNKQRLEHLAHRGHPHPSGGSCCTGSCMLHLLLNTCGAAVFLSCCNRGDTRKRYGIKGGSCGDCCLSLWCGPCALTQESQEIRLEEGTYSQRY
ncbi:PLAC8-domain-containing protein [Mycena floridula]|nr:PLAC8-domain-containing protein [Mycena floridula]